MLAAFFFPICLLSLFFWQSISAMHHKNVARHDKTPEESYSASNKWHYDGPNDMGLDVSGGDDLLATHNGQNEGWRFVRAERPIFPGINSHKTVHEYFEVKIFKINFPFCKIGFMERNALLGNFADWKHGGFIAIRSPDEILLNDEHIKMEREGSVKNHSPFKSQWQQHFKSGNVVGCGLIYSSPKEAIKFYFTLNGKYLGSHMVQPGIFGPQSELFPFVSLHNSEESVRANFGQREWFYNPNKPFATKQHEHEEMPEN